MSSEDRAGERAWNKEWKLTARRNLLGSQANTQFGECATGGITQPRPSNFCDHHTACLSTVPWAALNFCKLWSLQPRAATSRSRSADLSRWRRSFSDSLARPEITSDFGNWGIEKWAIQNDSAGFKHLLLPMEVFLLVHRSFFVKLCFSLCHLCWLSLNGTFRAEPTHSNEKRWRLKNDGWPVIALDSVCRSPCSPLADSSSWNAILS